VEPAVIRPLRKLRTLRGSFDDLFRDEAKDPLLKEAEDDYIEAVLTDPDIKENPLVLLRRRFPWILSVKQETAFAALRASAARPDALSGAAAGTGERRGPAEDFEDFLLEIYEGEDPEKSEKIEAFKELLEEVEKSEAEN
jgi:hypothetical protein